MATLLTFAQTPYFDLQAGSPPVADKVPHVTELHGEKLEDDYGWLRGKDKKEVIDYLNKENAYFDAAMAPTKPLQDKLYEEILGRVKQTDRTAPVPKGGWLYFDRTEEGQSYRIRLRMKDPGGEEQVMLDENAMAEGKPFFSVGLMEVSDDGNLLAYTTDTTGYRQYDLCVKDLTTGKVTEKIMPRVDSVQWAADNETLYVIQEDPTTKRSNMLFRIKLGGGKPEFVMQEDDGLFDLYLHKTQDSRFFVFGGASKEENDAYIVDTKTPEAKPRLIFARKPKERYDLEHNGDKFYVRTDKGAKNFKVVSAPESDPSKWTDVIPHDQKVRINRMLVLKNFLAVEDRSNGLPGIRYINLHTGKIERMAFDDATYTTGFAANLEFDTDSLRFNYASPVVPLQVMELGMADGSRTMLKLTEVPNFDKSLYTTDRVWATASDGTKIPIGLVYRKDMKKDKMPTLLYGYGSYGISASFGFNSNVVSLLDRGFIYAVAQIRGGGDMGEEWYDQGKMAHKMNTFTDFIACADFLVSSNRTDRDKLAIMGGSAGGLLMGAVINLRPDVCKAAVALVPFVDVINTMSDETLPLTTQEFNEWGNPKVEQQYRWIRAYSPYENIRNTPYPTMLVETSLNDSQVGYHEPAKYVARMRATRSDKNPLLFKCRMAGGHGGASGRYDSLKDVAMQYAFILTSLSK